MRLLAIADLHLSNPVNRSALADMPAHPDDWLILVGDVGDTPEQLEFALETLLPRFAQLLWVPGNHDLWTTPDDPCRLRGVERYEHLVSICRARGVSTPEDPFPVFTDGAGADCTVALLFALYDYTFRPPGVSRAAALPWALADGVVCSDERLLFPDPHPTREAWCADRVRYSESRLAAACQSNRPLILVNHFPLRQEHAVLPAVPRFCLWCGTTQTEDRHRRFNALAVVYGHLHIRRTSTCDGVLFHEVSLGYPRQWNQALGVGHYVRQILPRQ